MSSDKDLHNIIFPSLLFSPFRTACITVRIAQADHFDNHRSLRDAAAGSGGGRGCGRELRKPKQSYASVKKRQVTKTPETASIEKETSPPRFPGTKTPLLVFDRIKVLRLYPIFYAVFCPRYLGMEGIQVPSGPTKYPSGVYSLQYMEPCGLPSWYTGFR